MTNLQNNTQSIENKGIIPNLTQDKLDNEFPDLEAKKDEEKAAPEKPSFFTIKTAKQTIIESQKKKMPRRIFGRIWAEGELCILYGDSNCGKSILAVQIADAITKGKNIETLKCRIEPQAVLYFDFELSDKQFEIRYAEWNKNDEGDIENTFNAHNFSNDFLRAYIGEPSAIQAENSKQYEIELMNEIEKALILHKSKILIIDNLSYIKGDAEKAADALPFMKALKDLKVKHELSILLLGHTPKRNPSNPLTMNDLTGSKMLMNFFDTAFAIGTSVVEPSMRYIKQMKERSNDKEYGTDNVITCSIEKPTNFLKFSFVKFSNEKEHLRNYTEDEYEDRNSKIVDMIKVGNKYDEIAKEFSLSTGMITKIRKKYEQKNGPIIIEKSTN
jgi:ABC-type dipeptide/oligopeptide/nickel transport system ATPase component